MWVFTQNYSKLAEWELFSTLGYRLGLYRLRPAWFGFCGVIWCTVLVPLFVWRQGESLYKSFLLRCVWIETTLHFLVFWITGGRHLEKKQVKAVEKRGSGFTAALLVQPSTVRAIHWIWSTSLGDNSSIIIEDMTINLLVPEKSWRSETLNREQDPLSCTCSPVGNAQGQPAWSRSWTIGCPWKAGNHCTGGPQCALMGPVWGVGSAASWFYMLMGKMCWGKHSLHSE